jgi:hypothetical protein
MDWEFFIGQDIFGLFALLLFLSFGYFVIIGNFYGFKLQYKTGDLWSIFKKQKTPAFEILRQKALWHLKGALAVWLGGLVVMLFVVFILWLPSI